MRRAPVRRLAALVAIAPALALLLAALPAAAHVSGPRCGNLLPMIFVHGGSGSGQQFESQKMRFTSNGYPEERVAVLEYDSGFDIETMDDVHARLDALIADLQERTGCDRVELLGHSLGTFVSQAYLATPARAANVAHYVNIDGAQADAPPGGVPTLALWAGTGPPGREIVGATNVTVPGQYHVETATSEESFVEMYRFFRGREPFTTRIRPQLLPEVAGRAVLFPQNVGVDGATLEVWWVRGDTGARIGRRPWKTFPIGPDGDFGPFRVLYGLHYEFALLREGAFTHHFYVEPFVRTDHLVRLNTSVPGEGIDAFLPTSANHTILSVNRNKEFVYDEGDVLEVDGTNIVNANSAPPTFPNTASIFAFDADLDQTSHVDQVPFPFSFIAFLSAVDLYIPADPPGSVSVVAIPRGDTDAAVTVNVPNIPSTEGRVTIQLNDFD